MVSSGQTLYHSHEREMPLPLYMGLKLHVNNRSKIIIQEFHHLGLTVTYKRIMELRKKLAQGVSCRFKDDGVVVPTKCKHGAFSTATVDNIDVAGRTNMHGTSITLIAHLTRETMGKYPPPLDMDMPDDSFIEIPDNYAVVHYVEDTGGDIFLEPNGVMTQVLDNTQSRVCISEQA